MVWLCICSLFLFVCELSAQLCNPHSAQTCPYQEVLVDRMHLIPVSDIENQCRKHHAYFKCMIKFVGDCDALSRLKWEPLKDQTGYICGAGKTVYSSHADCWTNSTKRKLVDCNRDFMDDIGVEPCGALTKYVSCAETTVKGECGKGARQVLKDMAKLYVRPMQFAFDCNIEEDLETTTTTSPSTEIHSVYVNSTHTGVADTTTTSGIPVTRRPTSARTTSKSNSGHMIYKRKPTFQIICVLSICSIFFHLIY